MSNGVMVSSGPGLWLRAMSGSVELLHPGLELMLAAPENMEGHAEPS